MYVERFDSAPIRGMHVVASQTLGDKCARIWDVGDARVNGKGARIVYEVVDRLAVWFVEAGRGDGGMWVCSCEEARGDFVRRCALVHGAVERREEVVDVAVEGGETEGAGVVVEEEGVYEGTMLRRRQYTARIR